MSYFPLLLVVVAAFIHAGWNLLVKQAADAGPIFVSAYNLVICVAYAPWVIWLLIAGEMQWSWTIAGCILLSAIVTLGYSLCLQRGYRVAEFSVVYPVARGTGPTLSSIGALLLLDESMRLSGFLGLIAVVAGIALISAQGDLSAFRKPAGRAGVLWGVATGGLIACYSVVDAWGVKTLGIAPVIFVWFTNVARFFLLAPMALSNPARTRKLMQGKWWLAICVGLLAPLSYILVLRALQMGAPLSIVAPMREVSMIFAALLGLTILHERVGFWRLTGCAVLIAGVVMLGRA
jgi:drug/metabolite transporter (DMT)-like permease